MIRIGLKIWLVRPCPANCRHAKCHRSPCTLFLSNLPKRQTDKHRGQSHLLPPLSEVSKARYWSKCWKHWCDVLPFRQYRHVIYWQSDVLPRHILCYACTSYGKNGITCKFKSILWCRFNYQYLVPLCQCYSARRSPAKNQCTWLFIASIFRSFWHLDFGVKVLQIFVLEEWKFHRNEIFVDQKFVEHSLTRNKCSTYRGKVSRSKCSMGTKVLFVDFLLSGTKVLGNKKSR